MEPSHNYYLGREEADITEWLEYFCAGVLEAFTRAAQQMEKGKTSGSSDQAKILHTLDPKQRKVLELFQNYEIIKTNK